ncbi:DUF6786 family protein [Parapedobacter sp. 10938]|uniref:DUF6786 family protein n=1 Tax=Parapedobacter flavus TaxID=3110225 RepID=UPI002DBCFA06|nr:DUF6786 family protein [Parapedobacter sp. 10938]MEC3879522.1 DUF6786 family protein [Parapedobacter sp. 10938]
MKATQLIAAFKNAGKRIHIIGNENSGVIAALDLEGRLFTVLNGQIVNRVNTHAISAERTSSQYVNPGGDGLWPAPEGTACGYQYATGQWRVPPAIRFARFQVGESGGNRATIMSEIDLVNNQGKGIPTVFERQISILPALNAIDVNVRECITYCGTQALSKTEVLLAPWTLCQFNCDDGCEVFFPSYDASAMWDLYDHSVNDQRRFDASYCYVPTKGNERFQIGLDKIVPWIAFRNPSINLFVHRQAEALAAGQSYIDISDAPPSVPPDPRGVRYSIYSDSNGFMEIEAVGGCPDIIFPGTTLCVSVNTKYVINN